MANSPSHRLGQIIGDFLEDVALPLLEDFCRKHSHGDSKNAIYLDKKGSRTARPGQKLTWYDKYGNAHDLDFVIERGGNEYNLGHPVAFIEAAWRRYAKHSKNKAQEIQGAVLPIVEKYAWNSPFMGAFLAGVFTGPAIEQMKSAGFVISLFPYDTIIEAFSTVNVDISFDEQTTDIHFDEIVANIEGLDKKDWDNVKKSLLASNENQINNFFTELDKALTKKIERLYLIPLHGITYEFKTAEAMITFVREYKCDKGKLPLVKYEVFIRYTNGSEIRSQFQDKEEIYVFLEYISRTLAT